MTARKLNHLRLLAGTHRPDRDRAPSTALPALDSLAPPAWLRDLNALAEWHRLAPILAANGLLHVGNVGGFAQYCCLHGYMVTAWCSGTAPSASMIGQHRKALNDLTTGSHALANASTATSSNRFSNNLRGGIK